MKMSDSARFTIFGDEIHEFATMSLTQHFSEIPGRKWICGMNLSDSARFTVFGDGIHEFPTMCLDSAFLRDSRQCL